MKSQPRKHRPYCSRPDLVSCVLTAHRRGLQTVNRLVAFGIVFLLAALGGCATTRGVVDLPTASSTEPAAERATSGIPVFISIVEDQRVFELSPKDPSIPSLKDGQIENSELKSRAIARKRNTWGKALGDVMLPEGKTVTSVVKENARAALEDSGYRVVDQPGEGVPEIEIMIHKFWSWFTPGFWALKLEFQSELEIKNNLQGVPSVVQVKGYAHQKHQAATGGAWIQTMQVGMDDLRSNIRAQFTQK